MALKKSRKIVVGDKEYRWKISPRGGLHLAVSNPRGSRLAVFFNEGTAIAPGLVRSYIEQANEKGWWGGRAIQV